MTNLYQDTAQPAIPTPPIDGDARADVVVIGGGITGVSTALHLAESGAKVVLLEAEQPGWGASGRNGGQVNPGLKHDPDQVERDFGTDLGGRMNALAGAAPAFVFEILFLALITPPFMAAFTAWTVSGFKGLCSKTAIKPPRLVIR